MTELERRVAETGAWLAYSLDYMLDVVDGKKPPRGFKICSSCRRLLKLESFYRFHRSRDGRLGRCKSCFLTRREGCTRESWWGAGSYREVGLRPHHERNRVAGRTENR